jgi:hypothetical protein
VFDTGRHGAANMNAALMSLLLLPLTEPSAGTSSTVDTGVVL